MRLLELAENETLTCVHDGDADDCNCDWTVVGKGSRSVAICKEQKKLLNKVIDDKIAQLQALDVPAQIAALQAQKK